VLDHLHDKGTAAIIVPNGLLYSIGKIKEFRKKLIEKKVLEAIISLPSETFFQKNVATAILIFNNSKNNNNTLLINGTKMGKRVKERHQLSESDISLITEIVLKYRAEDLSSITDKDLFITITSDDFKKNDFDFQFVTYTTTPSSEKTTRKPSKIIWQEIQNLNNQLNESLNHLKDIMKN
jgi:type I restriction enzyme M protein